MIHLGVQYSKYGYLTSHQLVNVDAQVIKEGHCF